MAQPWTFYFHLGSQRKTIGNLPRSRINRKAGKILKLAFLILLFFDFQSGALSGRAKVLSQPCRGHIKQKSKDFVIHLKRWPVVRPPSSIK